MSTTPSARSVIVHFAGERRHAQPGATVGDFLDDYFGGATPDNVVAALVNRRAVPLGFPLRGSHVDLETVTTSSRIGAVVVRRSTSMVLLEAAHDLFPDTHLEVGQSLGGGYFYSWRGPEPVTPEGVASLTRRMEEICAERRPFTLRVVTLEDAEEIFRSAGAISKLQLLATHRASTLRVVSCGAVTDIAHGPTAPTTGHLRGWALVPYGDGLLLRFPRDGNREELPELRPQPKLFAAYRETRSWNESVGVANVGTLNALCISGEISQVIRVAEGFHEKRVAQIADAVVARGADTRVVLVAGPSSSGKTSFIKRLAIQIRVNGLTPVGISLDDYFVDREHTPPGANGKPDYESIEALDLELLNDHLRALLRGEEVAVPRYDFTLGRRMARDRWHPQALRTGEVLLIEGIHGLNPRLTESVPDEMCFRVFISALTQLTLDDHNRIFTSDARLIRRIVRDRLFRNHATTRTLEMWPDVRRGEARWIFPFQEQADVMFNSALVYEPAVLKVFAERFLLEVPREHPTFTEAYRLLGFLDWFVPIFQDAVPQTSILREFIGGSAFDY